MNGRIWPMVGELRRAVSRVWMMSCRKIAGRLAENDRNPGQRRGHPRLSVMCLSWPQASRWRDSDGNVIDFHGGVAVIVQNPYDGLVFWPWCVADLRLICNPINCFD